MTSAEAVSEIWFGPAFWRRPRCSSLDNGDTAATAELSSNSEAGADGQTDGSGWKVQDSDNRARVGMTFKPLILVGGADRDRTDDLLNAIRFLVALQPTKNRKPQETKGIRF